MSKFEETENLIGTRTIKVIDTECNTIQIQTQELKKTQQKQAFKKIISNKTKRIIELIRNNSKSAYAILSIFCIIFVGLDYQSFEQECTMTNDATCLKEFVFPLMQKWITLLIINCLCALAHIHFLINRLTYPIISMIGILQIVYMYILSDQTITVKYYVGIVNALHLIFITIIIVFYFFIVTIIYLYKKRFSYFIFSLVVIFTAFFIFYNALITNSCQYWPLGINGKIEQIEGSCSIKLPKYCWYKITDGWFDASKLFHDCKKKKRDRDNFNKYFEEALKDGQYLGFLNLNQLSEQERMDSKIQNSAIKNAKGFQNLEEAKAQGYEVIFDTKNQKYHIEVQKNSTLAEERTQIHRNKETKSIAKNILVLFVDAISRQSMHIKFPKTIQWFQKSAKYLSYQPNSQRKVDENESYEFYKFNSYNPWTAPNLRTVMYNNETQENPDVIVQQQKLISIVEQVKENGFVTGHTSTYCQTSSLSFDNDEKDLLASMRFDHETQSFSCDPNYQNPENRLDLFNGPYSITKRCLYGKLVSEYAFEYAKSFFSKYNDSKKFFVAEFLEAHEGTGDAAKNLDEPMYQFLQELEQQQLLNDTVVVLYSDHGLHMQGLFYLMNLENVFIEINLPGLFICLPKEINKNYGNLIAKNQQQLITCENIHHFMNNLILGDQYAHKNKGLFGELQNQKTCSDVGIDEKYCSCF